MNSDCRLSRRTFLFAATGAAFAGLSGRAALHAAPPPVDAATKLPRVDFHVHMDDLGREAACAHARTLNVKIGVVEHAGMKGHPYPILLSSDADLQRWLDQLAGADVYRGIQAEGLDWAKPFSKAMLAKLDFILTDAMTFVERDGRLVHLWKKNEVNITDAEDFMDRYVAHHETTIASGPLSIFAAPMYLPDVLAPRMDELWTTRRIERVVTAAARHGVALEINAARQLPTLRFLKIARAAGAKFAFGTNGRKTDVIGHLDYSLAMAKELKLTPADLFTPRRA